MSGLVLSSISLVLFCLILFLGKNEFVSGDHNDNNNNNNNGFDRVCEPSFSGKNGLHPGCPFEAPFCLDLAPKNAIKGNFHCKECMTDCDCSKDRFCSRNFINGNIGKCIKYAQEGNKCLPYSDHDLHRTEIKDEYKCATISKINESVVVVDRPHYSECSNGRCVWCPPSHPQVQSKIVCSGVTEGSRGPARVCNVKGKYTHVHHLWWNFSNFFSSPGLVFLFLVFLLLLLQLIPTILTTLRLWLTGRGEHHDYQRQG